MIGHLARRFVGSLWPAGPSAENEKWVTSVLSEREGVLWRRMSRADRRHAAAVARRVERSLGQIGVVLTERSGDGGWLRLTAKEDAKALAKWLNRRRAGEGR